ncbi:hypothetical protein RW092_13325 [Paenibacillus sp. 3LSP]|uniref:hypothetical protein n=1 Tax=Paenibacillus TaxID=44249 RepID=UPI00048FBB54|nr:MULTISPECIES: hypothetical protein [Paenibacillus]MDU0331169.1 hypothetical protein [Paenibacillus sp. 3LSP]SMF00681.1 hypothetical protein SAMN02744102_00893 [Paenibacillus barengoltzii]
MRKAYDTILQSEVSAELAAQNGGFEAYRYECSCCGEEVFIAAPYSTRMVAHFRHRSGNNDVECENYLGLHGAISTDARSRRSKRERVEFYFDNSSRMFYLGLRFSESEIKVYEQQNVDFELRTKDANIPFCTLRINFENFAPDVVTMIPLDHFSYSYYLSNTLETTKRKFNFFCNKNSPTFFKIHDYDNDFKAKLVRSNTIYTNTNYFVSIEEKTKFTCDCFPKGVEVGEIISFETMNRKFSGFVLTIKQKTATIDNLLESWGYRLDISETLTLLWPPSKTSNEVNIITSENAYIYSSFELQAHGNINVYSREISKISPEISKISITQRTKIFRKNSEIIIDKEIPKFHGYTEIIPTNIKVNKFTIPDKGVYYHFNRYGVSPLSCGQDIYLTPTSSIIHYEYSNYPVSYIYPDSKKEVSSEDFLNDILAHNKRLEEFDDISFSSITLSETASRYIDKCRVKGKINSVAKQFIKEGWI